MPVQTHQENQSAEVSSGTDCSPVAASEMAETSSSTPQASPSAATYNGRHHQNSSSKMAVKFFKTKLCPWFSQGRCRLGSNCNWAHTLQEVRDSVDLSRTKLCYHLTTQGKCTDPTCRFAHRREELRATTDVYKTSLCVFWMRGGCFIGQKCRYAHGLNDLRHYNAPNSHRTSSRPDLLMLDNPKERDNEFPDKESNAVGTVGKMGWTDPSLAAVAQALSSSGVRVGSRQPSTSFDVKGGAQSPASAADTAKIPTKSRPARLHPQGRESPSASNSQRAITQEELMTAMEALQSLLRVPQPEAPPQHLNVATTLDNSRKSVSSALPAPLGATLRRKLSNSTSSSPEGAYPNDEATSRLLAIAEKMTNLQLASRETIEGVFTPSDVKSSGEVLETSYKDVLDSLSWVIPGSMRASESSKRGIAKRLEEIDVRARLGLVQELKAAAVLSVVAANATLTTAEDLNTQISDMLTTMRQAQLPWQLAIAARGTDDQTTSASTHLGSNSERTDSVSNVSWRSNLHIDEANSSLTDQCAATQDDFMLSQLLEVIRRTHTRF